MGHKALRRARSHATLIARAAAHGVARAAGNSFRQVATQKECREYGLMEAMAEPIFKPRSRALVTWYVKLGIPERTINLAASKNGIDVTGDS